MSESEEFSVPSNFGFWLLETSLTNDELADMSDSWPTDQLIESLINLTLEWDQVIQNRSSADANRLIWRVFSYPFFLVGHLLTRDQDLKIQLGCELITLSIPRLHPPDEPMENGFFMLWDLIDKMNTSSVKVLERLLQHPDIRVQYAALHGLGHQGDDRIPVIQKFIQTHPDFCRRPVSPCSVLMEQSCRLLLILDRYETQNLIVAFLAVCFT